jgi:Ca2+-binding RTX toxin-like protein
MATKIGTPGPDTLRGTSGGDLLAGMAGDDRLLGRGGDDLLSAGPGSNLLDGGPGRDAAGFHLVGGDGSRDDWVSRPVRVDLAAGSYEVGGEVSRVVHVEDAYGGPGNDRLAGDDGPNRLFGGRLGHGNDVLLGRGGDDLLVGGDVLYGGGNNILRGGAGDDILQGGGQLFGGGGEDLLRLDLIGVEAWGGAGADQFDVFTRQGAIRDFEPGKDVISLPFFHHPMSPDLGGTPADAYVFVGRAPLTGEWQGDHTPEVRFEHRDGDTYVQFEHVRDSGWNVGELRLSGELELTADDFLPGFDATSQDDVVTGTRFADQVRVAGGDDVIDGRGGADRLDGGWGDDRVGGGAGDDVLWGGDGADIYEGGPGDDLLEDTAYFEYEQPSGDTYLFAGRFGHDVIGDPGGKDKVVFRGIAEDEVVLSDSWGDLMVTVEETGDSVLIRNYYLDPRFELVFDDGAGAAADFFA